MNKTSDLKNNTGNVGTFQSGDGRKGQNAVWWRGI